MEYLSVFSLNVGKYRPGKLQIWTLFTQCYPRIFIQAEMVRLIILSLSLSLFINTPILICLKLPFRQNNVKNNNNSNNPIIIITAIAFELSSISIEVERGYSSQTFQLHLLGANISTKLLLTIIIYRCRKYLPSILLFIANNPYLPPVKMFTVHGKTCRE